MSCIGCKYYDASVDCCNADDLCYMNGIDKLKSNCIEHIQKQKPLTIEEIIYIIQFEAYRLKGDI